MTDPNANSGRAIIGNDELRRYKAIEAAARAYLAVYSPMLLPDGGIAIGTQIGDKPARMLLKLQEALALAPVDGEKGEKGGSRG